MDRSGKKEEEEEEHRLLHGAQSYAHAQKSTVQLFKKSLGDVILEKNLKNFIYLEQDKYFIIGFAYMCDIIYMIFHGTVGHFFHTG